MTPLFESSAHRELRLRTSRIDLSQFSMITREQFDDLVQFLSPEKEMRMLDIGCGAGRIANEFKKQFNASVTAIDCSSELLNTGKDAFGDLVDYHEMDYEELSGLDGSFDLIYCIDSLYFTEKLRAVVEALHGRLKPDGRMAIFWTQKIEEKEDIDRLKASQTDMGLVLSESGIKFSAVNYTEQEVAYWRAFYQVIRELEDTLKAEGYEELVQHLKWESEFMLPYMESGKASRYLYKIEASGKRNA